MISAAMTARAFLHPAVLCSWAIGSSVRLRQAVKGHRRTGGDAAQILAAGLEECWRGNHLTASPGYYRQFWTRDTGFAAPALARLGPPHRQRLIDTLAWAMGIWRRRRSHITTTIHAPFAWPSDLFDYGVDSLPLFLASLRVAEADDLASANRDWIAAEVRYFASRVVDPASGLVRADRRFSAHRDTFRNGSNAYGNTMVALLAKTVHETGWGPDLLSDRFRVDSPNGAAGHDWSKLLREHFWMGDRFRDRLGSDETSGEANIFPFYAGAVNDQVMQRAALATLRAEGYADPYPLPFMTGRALDRRLFLYRFFAPDYQTTASWTSLGSIYLSLLRESDPALAVIGIDRMARLVEREGVLWEILDREGRRWHSRHHLSSSDYSMLWGAVLLDVLRAPTGPALRLGRMAP